MERAGRFREAGEQYLDLASRFPEYAQLDELYFNGAIDLQKAMRLGMTIRAFQDLIAKRPDSPLAKKATYEYTPQTAGPGDAALLALLNQMGADGWLLSSVITKAGSSKTSARTISRCWKTDGSSGSPISAAI